MSAPRTAPITSADDLREHRDDVLLAVGGDVHARGARLERVLARARERRPDALLFVGDLGTDPSCPVRGDSPARDARYDASLDELFARSRALGVPVLYVPGNHDRPAIGHAGNVDRALAEVAGLRVAGVGGAGPARFGFAYEWDEDEVRARDVPACDVLLCHAPPARTPLDVVARGGAHVGSEAIRELALRHDGVLVCGHIHEAAGAVELGRCLCLNAGALGVPYARTQVGWVRRSRALAGGWEVLHEDLEDGVVRRWARSAR